MIGRLVLAALIAGMAAGFIYGGVQHVQTTPLILAAEVYETAPAHDHAAAAADPAVPAGAATAVPAHGHQEEEWGPADGWQRTLSTTISSMITGAGFALLLAGVSLLTAYPYPKEWLYLGQLRFSAATVHLAPAAPERPACRHLFVSTPGWWIHHRRHGAAIFLIAPNAAHLAGRKRWFSSPLPHIIGRPGR